MELAVELMAFVLCVAACLHSVNEMEACAETRLGYFGAALIFGSAAVLISYWLGLGVTDWFMAVFQHGE